MTILLWLKETDSGPDLTSSCKARRATLGRGNELSVGSEYRSGCSRSGSLDGIGNRFCDDVAGLSRTRARSGGMRGAKGEALRRRCPDPDRPAKGDEPSQVGTAQQSRAEQNIARLLAVLSVASYSSSAIKVIFAFNTFSASLRLALRSRISLRVTGSVMGVIVTLPSLAVSRRVSFVCSMKVMVCCSMRTAS